MNTKRIRELNDAFRRTFKGGRVMPTSDIDALPSDVKAKVFQAVKSFDAFDHRNDPNKEHDFGAFKIDDQRYFWKIDYYKPRWGRGNPKDPADPKVTMRVLTIMFA